MFYITLLMISFSLTYFIKNYMIKKSFMASVNERSSHSVPTPHGGGIALAITHTLKSGREMDYPSFDMFEGVSGNSYFKLFRPIIGIKIDINPSNHL